MREPVTWKPYPAEELPVGRPVLCMNKNEVVPHMAVLETPGPTMAVLGARGERTGKTVPVSGLVEWADVCPGVVERRDWVRPRS